MGISKNKIIEKHYGGCGELVNAAGCGPAIEGSIPSGLPIEIRKKEKE